MKRGAKASSTLGGSAPTRLELAGASNGLDAALNERVRLYLSVTTQINLVITAVGIALWRGRIDPALQTHGGALMVQMVLLTSANALAWLLMARARPPFRVALVVHALVTLVIGANYAFVIFGRIDVVPPQAVFFLVLVLTLVLVLRSALVPSPALATTVIGALTFGLPSLLAFSSPSFRQLDASVGVWSGVLSVLVVGVTVLTSHTIYGLEHRVRATALLGQYRLERRLGRGSMGEVYLATHALLNRPTAVKLLRDGSRATARERFRQEVQVASGLTHPNTVEIYDYGRTPEGVFYFAMEYVEGATLEEVVRATGVMPPARVVHVLEQAAASLAEAHGRGLVHRDVKPSNLMLCERGGTQDTLKVMDFGLVHEIGGVGRNTASRDGVLTGTPLYLAPEAILDAAGATAESDVYALGVTAYFLLAGRAPFEDGDLVEVLSDHLVTPPPPIDVGDAELVDLVMRCLAKEPTHRPPNARALLRSLEACALHGRWSADDARIWWAEHGALVSSARATSGGAAQPGASSRSTGEAGASA